ncbi:ribosomal protein S18-alanine N-acetyltransferase [Rhodovibrionaceae bacterium A322]
MTNQQSSGDSLTLRPCGPFDAELLAGLHGCCFPEDPWNQQAMGDLLAAPNIWGLLAAKKEDPLGFILLRQALDELEILTFGVLPLCRGKGVARLLLAETLSQASGQGVTDIFLEVAQDNHAAKALYTSAGFQQVGQRRGYYKRPEGGVCDALILKRSLTATDAGS